MSMFLLVDNHGEIIRQFESRVEALDRLALSQENEEEAEIFYGVVEIDEAGRRVGEPYVLVHR